jgi:penicillin-binding protein 2
MKEFTRNQLSQRKLIAIILVFILFLILFSGFFQIQLTGADKYYEISYRNSVRQLTQYPSRGVIHDVNGQIVVDNRPSFFISVIPRSISGKTIQRLAKIINEEPDLIREKIRGRNSFRPVIVKKDLKYETVVELEENRLELPGVLLEVEGKRFFPPSVFSPHIFGYVGEVTQAEAEKRRDFESGEMVGKAGLEYSYDASLRGVKGMQFVQVDAEGRDLGLFGMDRNIDTQPGKDLYMTLDYNFQQFAESLMVDKRGAIVALDTRSGGVLAFVSKPDYDPRILTGKISSDVWTELQSDTSHPLYNRVIQSRYPPGSTYKLVAAIAALQEGIITPSWSVYCPGYFRLGRKTIHCWNEGGHGEIDLLQAIKGSCNVYFYQLGLKIGLETWSEYSKRFFFGIPTGIDLPSESSGLVPTVEYFDRVYGEGGWTKGNLANLAIGQGELLTTPLQMAQFAMILATKGIVHSPHFASFLYDKLNEKEIPFLVKTKSVKGVSAEVYDIIRQGMRQVVDGGTGWRASVPGIEVAGKTGTSQNPHGEPHAWFIGFAPYENPAIAIAVIIENGGGGGAFAAPLAELCLEKYFHGRILPRAAPAKKDTSIIDTLSTIIELDVMDVQRLEVTKPDSD